MSEPGLPAIGLSFAQMQFDRYVDVIWSDSFAPVQNQSVPLHQVKSCGPFIPRTRAEEPMNFSNSDSNSDSRMRISTPNTAPSRYSEDSKPTYIPPRQKASHPNIAAWCRPFSYFPFWWYANDGIHDMDMDSMPVQKISYPEVGKWLAILHLASPYLLTLHVGLMI